MCTVTFIATKEKIYITSNRDEKSTRSKALPPAVYPLKKGFLLYPKDTDAGGTWIAVKYNGDAAVLLNGASSPHISTPPYRQSRGFVVLHTLKCTKPLLSFTQYRCQGIEPFTLILYTNNQLYECRWTGKAKSIKLLSLQKAYIWSSVTLYSLTAISKRNNFFQNWMHQNPQPTQQAILDFHRLTGEYDKANDLLINQNKDILTVSITSVAINNHQVLMNYWDAVDDLMFENIMAITPKDSSIFSS